MKLTTFVERWYAEPLAAGDGNTRAELDATEASLGVPLPATLRDWYTRLGLRLQAVQDSPRLLGDLAVNDGGLCVWM